MNYFTKFSFNAVFDTVEKCDKCVNDISALLSVKVQNLHFQRLGTDNRVLQLISYNFRKFNIGPVKAARNLLEQQCKTFTYQNCVITAAQDLCLGCGFERTPELNSSDYLYSNNQLRGCNCYNFASAYLSVGSTEFTEGATRPDTQVSPDALNRALYELSTA